MIDTRKAAGEASYSSRVMIFGFLELLEFHILVTIIKSVKFIKLNMWSLDISQIVPILYKVKLSSRKIRITFFRYFLYQHIKTSEHSFTYNSNVTDFYIISC